MTALDEPAEPPMGARVSGRRFGWRQHVIVGLVCALVGVAIPFGVQAAERATASAHVRYRLRADVITRLLDAQWTDGA